MKQKRKKKDRAKLSKLRPAATAIINNALSEYFKTITAGERTATAIWFLALAHGVSAEIYEGIDTPISIESYGKKGEGLSVMLWSGLSRIYYVDIFTKNNHATIETVYCLDTSEQSVININSDEELIDWLMSKFEYEVTPLL